MAVEQVYRQQWQAHSSTEPAASIEHIVKTAVHTICSKVNGVMYLSLQMIS